MIREESSMHAPFAKVPTVVVGTLLLAGCINQNEPIPALEQPSVQIAPAPPAPTFEQTGKASWYGNWHHGKKTASGEKFDKNDYSAAHRTLPLGTEARVTNLENGKTVDVTVNDRGPFKPGRVIDLSEAAAKELEIKDKGVAPVKIEVVEETPQNSTVSTANVTK
jgi:rare lipoprotein A